MKLRVGALAFILSLACGGALAQPYRWTDTEGKTHYSDTPPPSSATNVGKPENRASVTATPRQPFELEKAMK
ncbi:MAG: DUF4124 domain-containing protein, partial [Sphingomonadaceae bacterium]